MTDRDGSDVTGGAERKPLGPHLSPEATALIQGYQELGHPQPTQTDMIRAVEFVGELAYLTVPQMLDRMREHREWCVQNGKPEPRTLGGYWRTLRAENDYRRDNGAGPPGASSRPPGGGLSRIGPLLPGGTP